MNYAHRKVPCQRHRKHFQWNCNTKISKSGKRNILPSTRNIYNIKQTGPSRDTPYLRIVKTLNAQKKEIVKKEKAEREKH